MTDLTHPRIASGPHGQSSEGIDVLYPEDKRQNIIADAIRANFSELMKLSPAERKVRIDQLLKPNVERTR